MLSKTKLKEYKAFMARHRVENEGTEFLLEGLIFEIDTSLKICRVGQFKTGKGKRVMYLINDDLEIHRPKSPIMKRHLKTCSTRDMLVYLKIVKKLKELKQMFDEGY
jgi:hypothetical protein